jgi:hypothetical protein
MVMMMAPDSGMLQTAMTMQSLHAGVSRATQVWHEMVME